MECTFMKAGDRRLNIPDDQLAEGMALEFESDWDF